VDSSTKSQQLRKPGTSHIRNEWATRPIVGGIRGAVFRITVTTLEGPEAVVPGGAAGATVGASLGATAAVFKSVMLLPARRLAYKGSLDLIENGQCVVRNLF
jgi:hypothetical protein